MTAIVKSTATVYRGGGRRYFSLAAAYHGEARQRVNAKCECPRILDDEWPGYCDYCNRAPPADLFDGSEGPYKPPDPYRTRLIKRLARWLRWCDERMKKELGR